ncbi:unnamed protein product [Owenia fusiformis]|uniref:Uncharacterized protein n=1 Tax=Owenia fusiformis TaxID=6347 RepID=A0A8S4NDE0_OWEFU|nr:unnamed protein product [Owenia fusiformis]
MMMILVIAILFLITVVLTIIWQVLTQICTYKNYDAEKYKHRDFTENVVEVIPSVANSETCKEKRLTLCAEEIADCIKVNYEDEEVQEHKDFIENVVDVVSETVGWRNPEFKTHPKLPNGSFYQETKVEIPNEFDFLNPLNISTEIRAGVQNTKQVFIDKKKYPRFKNKYDYSDFLSLSSYPQEIVKQGMEELHPYDNILKQLQRAVSEALDMLQGKTRTIGQFEMRRIPNGCENWSYSLENNLISRLLYRGKRFVYKGQCDLKASKREFSDSKNADPRTLGLNEALLDTNTDGPCITLAIGGPLCVTYMDMTLCIEDKQESKQRRNGGKYFVLPRKNLDAWMRTEYKPGNKELDKHHRKILMILKYCLIECKKYQYRSKYNSHVLKTLVLNHRDKCKGRTLLGRCFDDVSQKVFRLGIESDEANSENLIICSKWLKSLPNVGYPGGDVIEQSDDLKPCDILFTLVLYILVEFMKSSPEAVDLLHTREALSICLQLICKYSMQLTDIHITSDSELKYTSNITMTCINDCISQLRDLRHKGNELNILLSSPPFPYEPYWPDPNNPICISLAGDVEIISKDKMLEEWDKWKNLITKNLEYEKQSNTHQGELRRQEEIKLKEEIKVREEMKEEVNRQERIRWEEIRQEVISQEKIIKKNIEYNFIKVDIDIIVRKIMEEYKQVMGNEKDIQEDIRHEIINEMRRQDMIRQEVIRQEKIIQEENIEYNFIKVDIDIIVRKIMEKYKQVMGDEKDIQEVIREKIMKNTRRRTQEEHRNTRHRSIEAYFEERNIIENKRIYEKDIQKDVRHEIIKEMRRQEMIRQEVIRQTKIIKKENIQYSSIKVIDIIAREIMEKYKEVMGDEKDIQKDVRHEIIKGLRRQEMIRQKVALNQKSHEQEKEWLNMETKRKASCYGMKHSNTFYNRETLKRTKSKPLKTDQLKCNISRHHKRKANCKMKLDFNKSDRKMNSTFKLKKKSESRNQAGGKKSGGGRRNIMKANIRRTLHEGM